MGTDCIVHARSASPAVPRPLELLFVGVQTAQDVDADRGLLVGDRYELPVASRAGLGSVGHKEN
jgi:hypothetical protein